MCEMRMTFGLQHRLDSGSFSSVFTNFEDLIESSDYEDYIRIIAAKKKIDKYYNIIDFTFVELFPEWKGECFRYYEGKAVLLKDHPVVTHEMIKKWDKYLCRAAKAAKIYIEEKYYQPWNWFRMSCYAAAGGKQLSLPLKEVFPTKNLV